MTAPVPLARTLGLGFAAGFLSVLVFHQGTAWLLHMAGLLQNAPFSMQPVPPLGVPRVLSAAFWGGVWGVVLAAILAARPALPALLTGFLVGAVGATLVAWTLVAALRGQPLFAGCRPFLGDCDLDRLWRGPLLNGAFGWGAALLLVAMGMRRHARRRSPPPGRG